MVYANLTIVGGELALSESAWQVAQRLGKRERARLFAERAQVYLDAFMTENKGLKSLCID
jgi:folate-dependent tRNA-U54 methylase TrmFO/GidA